MQFKQLLLLVAFSVLFVTNAFSQHKRVKIKNGIAINGGITQYDISTDNFEIKKGEGFTGGLTATVDLPHKWYTVSYGMQFSDNNFSIKGSPTAGTTVNFQDEDLEYNLKVVQVAFLFHAKLFTPALSIDVGPQLQYNSQLELKDSRKEGYFLTGFDNLLADDVTGVNQFNVNALAGASAGIGAFRLRAQYSYGLTNMFGKFNKDNLDAAPSDDKFEGHQQMLSFTLMITF